MPAGGRDDCNDAFSGSFPDFCNFWDPYLDVLSPRYCTTVGLEDIPWGTDCAEGLDVVWMRVYWCPWLKRAFINTPSWGWLWSVLSSARLMSVRPSFEMAESGAKQPSVTKVELEVAFFGGVRRSKA